MREPQPKPIPFEPKCSVCGRPGMFGTDVFLLKGFAGTWYCPDHWWQSEHGVEMSIERSREACDGVENVDQ